MCKERTRARVLFTVATPQVAAVAMVAHHEHYSKDRLDRVVVIATEMSRQEGWEEALVTFLHRFEHTPEITVVDIRNEASATDVVNTLEREVSPQLPTDEFEALVDFTGGLAIHRLALLLYATRTMPARGLAPKVTVLYADPAVRGIRRVPWGAPLSGEMVEQLTFGISLPELMRLHGYEALEVALLEDVLAQCGGRARTMLRNLYELALENPVARGFLARPPRRGRMGPGRIALESLEGEELRAVLESLLSHEVVFEAMKEGFSELERAGLRNGAEKAASVLRSLALEAIQGEYASDLLVAPEFLESEEGRAALETFVRRMEAPPERGGVGARYNGESDAPLYQDLRLPEELVQCLGSWKSGVLFESIVFTVLGDERLRPAWTNVKVASRAQNSKCVAEYDLVGIHPDGRAYLMEMKSIRAPISGMRKELLSKVELFRKVVGRYGEAYLILPFLQQELDLIAGGGRPPWLSPHHAASLREWLADPHFPMEIRGLDSMLSVF